MKILILGNSNIFIRKIQPALLKFKDIQIEIASKRKVSNVNGISKIYKNYGESLKKTNAKIVYISLINSKHYYWGLRALNENKHIIIDKPITLNYKDSLKLINKAKKKNLLIAEATVFHLHKQFNNIVSLINTKKKIIIKTFFHIPRLNKKNYRNNVLLGGGCFNDMSTYGAYLIYLFLNKEKNLSFKKKHYIKNKFSNGFEFAIKNKNILLKSSFKFNSKYLNMMTIENDRCKYSINYAFSPPINQKLSLKKVIKSNNREELVYFSKENVFYTFFKSIFKNYKMKKYINTNNKLMITEKIRNEISK